MPTIVVEEDHFLKIIAVILDPATSQPHQDAVARFMAHDVPDFAAWCETLRAKLPGLFPARVIYADGQADFLAKLPEADAVIVESLKVDTAALAHASKLKLVQKFGTLAANIDEAACAARGVRVEKLRRIGNVAVAEQAFALMMALAKRITALDHVVTQAALAGIGHTFRPRSPHIGYSNAAGITGLKTLHGATLGIVGLGEVGRELAAWGHAFGMTTLYHQRTKLSPGEERRMAVAHATLADLMAASDYVVVQVPLNDATRGLIGRDALAKAKPGLILINVARAELIDRDALIEALETGRIGGLGLDVGYSEPYTEDDPLLRFRGNVILMPHTAIGARQNGLADMETMCVNAWKAICG